jgi:hypothetical protein
MLKILLVHVLDWPRVSRIDKLMRREVVMRIDDSVFGRGAVHEICSNISLKFPSMHCGDAMNRE